MSAKQKHHKKHKQVKHQTESSTSHNPRAEHDRKARTRNDDVYANEGPSRMMKYAISAVIAVVVITLTVLFIGGFINW